MGVAAFAVLGSGEHASVVADTLRVLGHSVVGFVAPRNLLHSQSETLYLGDDESAKLDRQRVFLANGIGSVDAPTLRRQIFMKWVERGFQFPAIVHPRAFVSSRAHVGDGAIVFANAMIQTGASVSTNVLLNSGAIVEHDCVVGAHTHIACGAVVCGRVAIGVGVHIGAGAIVRQGVQIGDEVTVGAGALVLRDVERCTLVYGVPARVIQREDI
jgi:sugar O-acyltransferase (sialic acid O-acetyltransferase NeuD family)